MVTISDMPTSASVAVRDTGTAEILQGLDGIVDRHLGKEAGTGVEYVNF